jgi:hypothetical protein
VSYELVYMRGPAAVPAAPERSCGDCRLCCKTLGIAELAKAPGEWCRHACEKGCAIYEARPAECRQYVCSWLAGTFREEDRPDRSRLVVHVLSPQRWAQDGTTGAKHELVEVFAGDKGAERTKRGRAVLEQILAAGAAAAVHFAGRVTLHFPSGHVSEVPVAQLAGDFAAWEDG